MPLARHLDRPSGNSFGDVGKKGRITIESRKAVANCLTLWLVRTVEQLLEIGHDVGHADQEAYAMGTGE